MWLPCSPVNLQVVAHPSPQISIINIFWGTPAPSGACQRLQYSISLRDPDGASVPVPTLSGCAATTAVVLPRRCDAYTVMFQSSFVFPNMTVGPACLNSASRTVVVRQPPQPPQGLVVLESTLTELTLSWQMPTDLGGCVAFNYTLYVTDLYNGDILHTTEMSQSTTSITVSEVTFSNGGSYSASVYAQTKAGFSSESIVYFNFLAPSDQPALTPGVLAGIIVGSLGGAVVLALSGWYLKRWYRSRDYYSM